MVFLPKHMLGVLVVLLFATTANAQICKESGESSSSSSNDDKHTYIDCDMTYRDQLVTCTRPESGANAVQGTRYSCPAKPMPMIKTPLKSLIKDYSPYVFAYARAENDELHAYNGPFSVGTEGGADRVFGMVTSTKAAGSTVSRLAGCVQQITFQNKGSSPEEEAKQVRLQLDNCANQYILHAAAYPLQKERSRVIDDPDVSSARISLKTECQPLDSFDEQDNEYKAGDYLVAAAKKTMSDAGYRKNKMSWTEPRMPQGLKLQNPIAIPEGLAEVKLAQIAAVPYEEINDPTHPFSPRWDFSFNERERYSPLTDTYMKETKNQVYCAGVREADNNDKDAKKEDQEVKVDVLDFRKKKFQTGILKRISYNTACKKDSGTDKANFFKNLATSYCHDAASYWYTWIPCIYGDCDPQSKRKECWEDCFDLGDEKLEKDKKPPCSTHYDEEDLKIKTKYQPGLFNGLIMKASCNPPPFFFRQKKHNIDKLCKDLRAPYTQINKLKMRYHNPDEKDYNAMKDGVPEGYTFKEYFGNHMPYPRLWDTGVSLQKSNSTDRYQQEPKDTAGQYTAIVGIGREGAIEKAGDDAKKKHKDERCKLGGWGNSMGFVSQEGFGKGMDGGMGNFGSQFGGSNVSNGGQGFDFNSFIKKEGGGSGTGFNMGMLGGGGAGGGGMGGMGGMGGGGMGGGSGGGGGSGAGGGMSFGNFGDMGGNFGGENGGMGDFSSQLNSMAGPTVKVGNYSIRVPDPITSWTELKLYQSNTLRKANISCLGRYEKVFKPGGTENLVLMPAGGEWAQTTVEKCPKDKSSACEFISLEDYKKKGADSKYEYHIATKSENWPVSWRGYISTGTDGTNNMLFTGSGNDTQNQFPNFGGGGQTGGWLSGATTVTGLDKAELGDIILLPKGPVENGRKPGLAKLALVTEVNTVKSSKGKCNNRGDCYVQVMEADNGKWPDVCGTTDANGELKSRYFYKSGNLPKPAKEEFDRIKSTYSCEDTKLAKCIFAPWDSVKLYRIANDIRAGCDKEKAEDCAE